MATRQPDSLVASPPRLRPAGWRDVPAIFAMHRACFPYPYPLWRFVGYQFSARARMWLAEECGRPAGYLVLAETTYPSPLRLVGEVISVAVMPEHRGRGVARRLLLAAIEHAWEVGLGEIYLQVAVDNAPALALYAGLGFTSQRRLPRYYVDGGDAWLMALAHRAPDELDSAGRGELSP